MVVIQSSDPIRASEQVEGVHENQAIANQLREIADLLAEQKANEFRVRAYRAAADTITHLPSPVREILEHDGVVGLVGLPTIGHSIANLVESALCIGRMPLLNRLRGQSNAEHFFATLPNVGPQLSHRIYEHLHVETLAELRVAAHDGRLERVPGLGRKRIESLQSCLAQSDIDTPASQKTIHEVGDSVSVSELLDIDREYRLRAGEGSLAKVKSSQQNRQHEPWLPIMHTDRDGRHYTAMFSNTARVQQQNATKDWLVIYRDDANAHGRWTIITSQFGKLRGFRIVRGRETDCQEYYRQHNAYHHREEGHAPYPELPTSWEEDEGRFGVHG